MQNKQRKDVNWYEWLYKISDEWDVMNTKKDMILKLCYDKDWYLKINLRKDKVISTKRVSRLVADAFIDRMEGKNIVDHKNWVRDDNRKENLQLVSQSENCLFKYHRDWYKTSQKTIDAVRINI